LSSIDSYYRYFAVHHLFEKLKTLKVVILFLFCQPAFCQDGLLPVNEQKNVVYSDVARLQKTRDEIYQKALKWAEKTLGNFENSATEAEARSGTMLINSYVPVKHSLYDYVRLDFTFHCSDNQYQVKIDQLDGTSPIRTPVRLSSKDNDAVTEKAMILKTETNRKKREEAEKMWQNAKADNDGINSAIYKLLANLKEYMTAEK